MNIYEDYRNYIDECDELIEMLNEKGVPTHFIEKLNDREQLCKKVTEYIYNEYEKNQKLDEDLEEIFDIGYGFLANVLADMKTYYEDAFDKNKDVFEQYSELLLYSILIEDFKSYMYSEELMNDEYEEKLNQLLNKLDSIFTNKKPIPNGLVEQIDATLSDMGIHNSDYRPAYSVFQMIAEELNLI